LARTSFVGRGFNQVQAERDTAGAQTTGSDLIVGLIAVFAGIWIATTQTRKS
jgi:hypothetical protein